MDIKTLKFTTQYGEQVELAMRVNCYSFTDSLAIDLYEKIEEDGEAYLTDYTSLTENLYDRLPISEAYIKDFAENEGLLEFVLENKLGKLLSEIKESGFNTYHKIAFDLERLKEFDKEGVEEYLEANEEG